MRSDDPKRLLAPIELGSVVAGWALSAADSIDDRGSLLYTFTSNDPAVPPLDILLSRRPDETRAAANTDLYALSFRNGDGSPIDSMPADLRAELVKVIRSNEHDTATPYEPWPRCVDVPVEPTLYLVPGHLGNVLDIGQRSGTTLSHVGMLFVEEGHADETIELLLQLNIAPGSHQIIEMGSDPARNREALSSFRAAVDDGIPCALFGVGEGTPAFCDVGSDLITEATRLGVPIRTVGGPSSLSLALMRLGRDVTDFTCLGRFEDRTHVDKVLSAVVPHPRLPVVLLADGRSCREHLPRILEAWPWRKLWLVQELTTEGEDVLALEPGQESAVLTALADALRIVVVIEPDVARIEAEAEQAERSLLGRVIRRLFAPRDHLPRR